MMEFKNIIRILFTVVLGLALSEGALAQDLSKEKQKELRQSQSLLNDAGSQLQEGNFPNAEADYRKAIALVPKDETGKYNLGNAYYNRAQNTEAMSRFKQAASVAQSKAEKHKAFHNLGNTFMKEKKYQEAVEAYKNALRNNPSDDETRYNFALAKDMLEKNPPQGGGDDDKDQNNKVDKNQQDQNKNEDQKDSDKEKEGDDGEEKEDKDQGDEKDEEQKGDKDKDKEGDQEKPKEQQEKEGDEPKKKKPAPGQLSPQQIKNLLEAMNNEEKKVQDKINAKKQKGVKVKSNKDW